jgi:hypothetical protein
MKIIQFQVIPETDDSWAEVYILTEEGHILRSVSRSNSEENREWTEVKLPIKQ